MDFWNLSSSWSFFCDAFLLVDDGGGDGGGGAEERMRLVVDRNLDKFWDRKFGTADGLVDIFILIMRLCFLVWIFSRFY